MSRPRIGWEAWCKSRTVPKWTLRVCNFYLTECEWLFASCRRRIKCFIGFVGSSYLVAHDMNAPLCTLQNLSLANGSRVLQVLQFLSLRSGCRQRKTWSFRRSPPQGCCIDRDFKGPKEDRFVIPTLHRIYHYFLLYSWFKHKFIWS